MLALNSQMLLCLLAAASVGFLVAWFLRAGQVVELTSEGERLRAIVPTGVLPSALSTRLELLARMMEEVKPSVDLTPIVEKLEMLSGHDALISRFDALTTALHTRLEGLVAALDELRSRPSPSLDLGPLHADTAAVERRVHALALELAALQLRLAAPPPPSPRGARLPREEWDDLTLIHGVGPVLQRLLHRMGVHRFEQMMNWDTDDIAAVTARLPNFKGRIEREGWVESARREYERKYGHRSFEAVAHSH